MINSHQSLFPGRLPWLLPACASQPPQFLGGVIFPSLSGLAQPQGVSAGNSPHYHTGIQEGSRGYSLERHVLPVEASLCSVFPHREGLAPIIERGGLKLLWARRSLQSQNPVSLHLDVLVTHIRVLNFPNPALSATDLAC